MKLQPGRGRVNRVGDARRVVPRRDVEPCCHQWPAQVPRYVPARRSRQGHECLLFGQLETGLVAVTGPVVVPIADQDRVVGDRPHVEVVPPVAGRAGSTVDERGRRRPVILDRRPKRICPGRCGGVRQWFPHRGRALDRDGLTDRQVSDVF